jgi:hypothetical protein
MDRQSRSICAHSVWICATSLLTSSATARTPAAPPPTSGADEVGAEARRSTQATPSRAESSNRRALWYISDSDAPPPENSIAAAVGVVAIAEEGVPSFFFHKPFVLFLFFLFHFGKDTDGQVGPSWRCDVEAYTR